MVEDEALVPVDLPVPPWDLVPLGLLVEPPDCPCCVEPAEPVACASAVEPVVWDVPEVRCGDPAPEVVLPEPSVVVSQVLAAVERVAACDPTGVPDVQALVDAQVLLRAAQVLRVHNLARVADAQVRQLHALTSARSTAGWLRQVAPDRPAGDLALARKLRDLPVLAERVASVPVRRPRSRGRRWHDALKRLLQAAVAADVAGSRGKAPVRMVVTVSERLLAGAPGALPAVGGSGRALPRGLVRRWWCDASVTPFLLSSGFRVVGVAHTTRTLTATERLALDLQSGGHRCAGLGCCAGEADPLTGLEPHHVPSWASTGRTSLGESIWSCPGLHHDLHHGKVVQLRDGRRLTEQGWVD